MKHKISYDQDNKILIHLIREELSSADLDEFFSTVAQSVQGSDNILALYDLTDSNSIQADSLEKFSAAITNAGYKKLAIVSPSITESAMTFSKIILSIKELNESSSFFKTKKEAIDWLKS